MSRDIESVLRDAVRDLASQARPTHGLAAAAIRRQRSIRLRRRIGGSLAALVAAAVIATPYVVLRPSATTVLRPPPSASPSATPSRHPRSTGPTTLPEASGVPGAVDRPELVGTDPGVLHFDVDLSVIPSPLMLRWQSVPGLEGFLVAIDDGSSAERQVEVFISERDILTVWGWPFGDSDLSRDITVQGRSAKLERYPYVNYTPPGEPAQPNKLPTWTLRWQPVEGLWVAIVARDGTDEIIRKVAETLRLDRSQYCVQPLVAEVVPRDARLIECWVSFRARGAEQNHGFGAYESSNFKIVNSRGATLMVSLGPKFTDLDSLVGTKDEFRANRRVGGYPAMWKPGPYKASLWVSGWQETFDLSLTTEVDGFSEDDVLAVAEGLRVVGDLNDPATWPRRPAE